MEAKTEELNEGEVKTPLFGALEGCRQRFFGGTTNHWSGASAPLEQIDFNYRPWVKYSGWPITRESIQPYYLSALEVLQLTPEALKYQNSEKRLQFKDTEMKHRFYKPLRFGPVYRAALEKAKNIEVILNSNLVKIKDGDKAGHVES
ncbi:MAG: hypothetical protein K2Q01_03415, partial [Rickettsiales bacterium]|nr:hypothetical protein [Rickettsiales bacterium]